MTPTQGPTLDGVRIIIPESRELDLFARMLEDRGAVTLRCPLVAIFDLHDPDAVDGWLRRLIAGDLDDLILLTGEGLSRLLAVAERFGMKAEAIAAIARLRTIVRGPKPVKTLRDVGLSPGIIASVPTTDGIIDTLRAYDLHGRKIGVQLYPDNPNDPLLDFLRAAGAEPDPVLPYRYASDSDSDAVEIAIRRMAAGEIDVIAFTSSPQIARLQAVARERGLGESLAEGLARTRIAAVGPLVAKAIEALGAHVAIMPESFHMKPLVNAIAAAIATRGADS